MLARHIVDRCTAEVMGFRDGTDYNVSSYVSPTIEKKQGARITHRSGFYDHFPVYQENTRYVTLY